MSEGKICNTCYQLKPFQLFTKEKTCPDGHRGKCKDCDRKRKQLHYQNNKEKYKTAFQDFMTRHPDYYKNIKNILN